MLKPLALNEPVGLKDSSFNNRFSKDNRLAKLDKGKMGVHPSPKLILFCGLASGSIFE
jgi:hypothetical protein